MALRYSESATGRARWEVPLRISPLIQIVAAARMKPGDEEILDYLLLPKEALEASFMRIQADGSHPLEIYRCSALEPLHALLMRDDLHEPPMGERILSAIVSEEATPTGREGPGATEVEAAAPGPRLRAGPRSGDRRRSPAGP